MRTIPYGAAADQVGDLYLPDVPRPLVVCLLHGGFWRMPYGRDHIAPIARDLAERGFVVWSLEYRRVGAPGGGWPGTLEDVGAGIDHLATLAAQAGSMALNRVAVVGHSAGGHLALWCARRDGNPFAPKQVRVSAAAGLAPVADLVLAQELHCGNGAVEDFLGGTPSGLPERYRATSPLTLVPLGVRQLIVHGTLDDTVPVEIARKFAKAATAAGDAVRFVELGTAGHMDFVDPRSAAHAVLRDWLEGLWPS